MKKNNVRLICTSVASGDTKNYAVVPVKVGQKKIDYTEDELKVLAESILNPKTKAVADDAVEEPVYEAVETEAPVEETEEAPVATDDVAEEPVYEAVETEAPVEETEEAPVAADDVAAEPVYEAVEAEAPVEEAEEAPVATDDVADEPVYEAVEVEAPVEEAEQAPVATDDVIDEPVYEAVEAEAPVEETEEAPVATDEVADEPVYEAVEAEAPVEEAEQAPVATDEVADEPVYEAVEAEAPVEEAEQAPVATDEVADEPVYEAVEVEEPVEEAEDAPVAIEEPAEQAVAAKGPVLSPIMDEEPVAKKRRRGLSLTTKKALSGWLFVLPFVIGILFIYAPIIFDSIKYTFMDSASIYTGEMKWIGFENYVYIFTTDEWFSVTIVDGLKDLILQIPAIVIFSLFMAIILNQKMVGRTVFRAIFFLPVILCTGIIDSIDTQSAFMDQVEGSQGGIDDNTGAAAGGIVSALDVEALLSNIKLGSELVDIVTTLINNIFDIVSRSGVQMLIFLSGLQSISPSIYESCQVEGASAWETFWKITLPMISPMILVNAVYTVIDLFTAADNRVMSYISKIYGTSAYGPAGAMTWVYIGIVLIFIAVVALLMKTVVFYQKRD